jgi:hypothetical protein
MRLEKKQLIRSKIGVVVALGSLALSQNPSIGQDSAVKNAIVYQQIAELDIPDIGKGPTKSIPLKIEGSTDLKLAFLAKATSGISTIPLNMFDAKASDNTTPKAYAWVENNWQPIVYRCDRFRYNASGDSNVQPGTEYVNLSFYGPPTPNQSGLLQLRNFVIYRGRDIDPPQAPTSLTMKTHEGGILLSWQSARDNIGIAKYVVSRSDSDATFIKVAESALPQYLDRPPATGTYAYRVLAVDFEDNISSWSEIRSLQVEQTSPVAELNIYERDRANYAQHVRQIHSTGRGKVEKGLVFQFGDSLTGAINYQRFTEAALGRYMVEARGRASWTTIQGRAVIASDIKQVNPEFCLILFGTNNRKSQFAIEEAMEDILAMAKACEENGTVPIVATIPPRGFLDPESQPEGNYNAALIQTCRRNKIPIAYLFEEFQAQPDRKTLLATDGIHWGKDGFPIAARAWKKAMEQVTFALLDRTE